MLRKNSVSRSLQLLVAGISWPPETFLSRLIDGLVQAGVAVTVGSASRPVGKEGHVEWLPTPSWDAEVPVRLARFACMAIRARFHGARDMKMFAPYTHKTHSFIERVQLWNQLLPYAGRRWDLIYYPWNSAAIANLPIFDLPAPVVVGCRGAQVSVGPHNPERQDLRAELQSTFEKAGAVHCVSDAILRDAIEVGLDPAKAVVIRPAVDPACFCPGPPSQTRQNVFSVITVGSLIWRKGYEWALGAIRRVADSGINVRFEIIGDGPDRQRVLYTIADLGLEQRVKLLGKLPTEEVLHRVQEADVFLLSSHSEGISNAALEAMACGIPVVTTDCGGMREAVTNGVEGFVVPVRDDVAMAGALERLANDPVLRQSMGDAARARVLRDFDLKQQVQAFLNLFRTVASS